MAASPYLALNREQMIHKHSVILSYLFFVACSSKIVYAYKSTDDIFEMSFKDLTNVSIASQFQESTLEASSSVYVINKEKWQAKGARRTNELMAYQPGTFSYPTIGGTNALAIRGFANILSVRGIATLLDGIPLNTFSFGSAQYFLANFDLGLIDRAEMIRGPASAVYGNDAFHGVFSLTTPSTVADSLTAEGGIGTPGYNRFAVNFNQASSNDSYVFSGIAGTHQGSSDIEFSVPLTTQKGERDDRYSSLSAVIKTDQHLTEQWYYNLGFYYNQFDANDFPGFGISSTGIDDLSSNEASFYMLKAGLTNVFANNIKFDINGYYWKTEQEFSYKSPLIPVQSQDDRRYGIISSLKHTSNDQTQRWLIGAGLDNIEVTSAKLIDTPQSFDGLERDVWNLYGEYRHSWFNQKLSLELGGRYDKYSDFGGQFTPRTGIIYQPNDQSAIKLLYGEAFRAPIAGEVTNAGLIMGNPDLDPETIKTYELIFMYYAVNQKASLTFFKSRWTNAIIIESDLTLPAPYIKKYVNRGAFESKGLEVEYAYKTDHWQVETAYSYVKSKNSHSNEKFTAFPDHIVNFDLAYFFNDYKTTLTWSNYLYFNTTATEHESSKKLGTIWHSNININYQYNDKVSLALDICDIFDRQDDVPSLWGNTEGLPSPGTEVAVYLIYQW